VGFDAPSPESRLNYNVRSFWARLEALRRCAERPWWPALVELVDRTFRIQRDQDRAEPVQRGLFQQPEEADLGALLEKHRAPIADLFAREGYGEAAELYCTAFARPVHEFFEKVFVNVEDEAVRRNRKSLCAEIYHLFADRFADLYLIQAARLEPPAESKGPASAGD
jgi:glycyl-tRNA synthetase beta chain